MIPEKSKNQKLEALAKNELTLSKYLENYGATFNKDLDEMWNQHDFDCNGYLDKEEARGFVFEISQCIESSRAINYDPAKFDSLFNKFDEN